MNTNSLNTQWKEIAPQIKQHWIVADHGFYDSAVDQFIVTIVDNEQGKQEQPFESILEQKFAEHVINKIEDIIGFFFHVSSHHRCDIFWETCPTPMEQFIPDHLDLIEEVYNQRLISVVAPRAYNAFPWITTLYDQYKGVGTDKRRLIQTMFTRNSNTGNVYLNNIHEWLYNQDPLAQQTFNSYMYVWSVFLRDQQVASMINQYES